MTKRVLTRTLGIQNFYKYRPQLVSKSLFKKGNLRRITRRTFERGRTDCRDYPMTRRIENRGPNTLDSIVRSSRHSTLTYPYPLPSTRIFHKVTHVIFILFLFYVSYETLDHKNSKVLRLINSELRSELMT